MEDKVRFLREKYRFEIEWMIYVKEFDEILWYFTHKDFLEFNWANVFGRRR